MPAAALSDVVGKAGELPPMPQVALKVLQLLEEPQTTAKSLEKVIVQDAGLTVRLLRIVNSALYGFRDIGTVSHAATLLGFRSLRSIVVAAAAEQVFRADGKKVGFDAKLLWSHSVVAAHTSRLLAEARGDLDGEEAFIGGLLHDIGKGVLNAQIPDEYAEIFQEVYKTPGACFQAVETERWGFDHAEVGGLVIEKWRLPDRLRDVVRYHHLDELPQPCPHALLVRIVQVANQICVRLGVGPESDPELDPTTGVAAEELGLEEKKFAAVLTTVEAQLDEFKEL